MAADLNDVERIKAASRHLRGSLVDSLANPITGALHQDDTQLSKFHGIYQQDDRDLRSERKRQRLEPAYSFMIRARVPGGVCTPEQWRNIDDVAQRHANGSIRLTTRQAIQLHGVSKSRLKSSVADINRQMMDTLAACGDVNRNVMAPTLAELSAVHREVHSQAVAMSRHLTPATRAYHEIWLDGEKLASSEVEPIYGDTYLPRKFKSAFVVPPQNDVDVFAQDLGFIAIVEQGKLSGYNVTVGGGMGMSHGEPETYPRLGSVLGFCELGEVLAVAEAVVTTQRDFGDRSNRKHARLKYTIDDRGIDWFRDQVVKRSGVQFGPKKPFAFAGNGDVYGWQQDDVGRWHYTLFVQNGRVADFGQRRLMSGLRAIAKTHKGEFRLTPNQNLMISNVEAQGRERIDGLLQRFGIENDVQASMLRLHSMACVAFPTCGLAMAESERYLPSLIDKLEAALERAGLIRDAITIRMTGCPNGCARPYIAEIGLVGKGPGRYNLYLGAGFAGEREQGERFGDFLLRSGTVPAVTQVRDFHVALDQQSERST